VDDLFDKAGMTLEYEYSSVVHSGLYYVNGSS